VLLATYILALCCLGVVIIFVVEEYILNNRYKEEIAYLKNKLSCPLCAKSADWKIIIKDIKEKRIPLNFGVCQEHAEWGVIEALKEIKRKRR